jgi:hypothetical protein
MKEDQRKSNNSEQGEVEQLKLEPTTHKLEHNSKTKSEGQNKNQKKMSAKQQQNNKPTPCWNITPSGPAIPLPRISR